MSTTLTVRIDSRRQKALARRAAARGTSVSALVREILDHALEARALGEKTGTLAGAVSLPRPKDPWRRRLRARNWRP